jgi:ubiquitin C-terminal hydrolase
LRRLALSAGVKLRLALRKISIISLAILYGFNQKTPQGKNKQAQTAQKAALESSQEAHLAEVISALRFHSYVRGRTPLFKPSANNFFVWVISADEISV